ncbi:4-hydroxy-tetrahydrodipicolinate synthase [Longirhabdus pacifica]|uniref:4-hydroxy-tetrahydrodipicolinate synthase n=1 Tax=Longirhabdus pacifica TaxID=2305227 RepID=UPI0010088078|nr:4-hydroxy-tetrahydrodipicolinate synthase [Longirhabdus pacifica]
MDFGRIITAMVTPFNDELEIDWEQTKKLIDYLIEEQKADGLVISGTTGESPTLSEEEKLDLFHYAKQVANGRCKIIAGTGCNDTNKTIEFSKKAELAEVDGLLIVCPYYNRPNQDGIYHHYKAVAESTSLPIMMYNVPARTGVSIAPETTIRLSEVDNIVCTKEAAGDLTIVSKIAAGTSNDFKIYSGVDDLNLPMLAVGGYGFVSVVSHVVGKELSEMVQYWLDGNHEKAASIHYDLLPVYESMFISPSPGPVKYALSLAGLNPGSVRLPLIPVNEEDRKVIIDSLKMK